MEGFDFLNEGVKLSAIATSIERQAEANEDREPVREVLQLLSGSDETMGFFGSLGRKTRAGSGVESVVDSFQGEADDVDVAFWNVEWLGSVPQLP